MKTDLPHKLTQLAAENATVTIKYFGGSQPGTKRRIQPITCSDTHLRALDMLENIEKNFLVSKLEIVDDNDAAPQYSFVPGSDRKPVSLVAVFTIEVEGLRALGWRVELSEESIKLYTADRDMASVVLQGISQPSITISVEKVAEQQSSSDRVWYVSGPDFLIDPNDEPDETWAESYKYFNKAKDAFLDQARRYAPKR